MKTRLVWAMACILCFGGWNPSMSEAGENRAIVFTIPDAIRKSIETSLAAFNRKDLKANMELMHPDSPEFKRTLVRNETTIAKYDVTSTLLDFQYICTSGEYQFVRIRQSDIYANGPFSTELELLYAFKEYQGHWKLWAVMQLNQKMLNRK